MRKRWNIIWANTKIALFAGVLLTAFIVICGVGFILIPILAGIIVLYALFFAAKVMIENK